MKRYLFYITVILTIIGTIYLFHYNREYALHPYSNEWARDSISLEVLNYKINRESMGLSVPQSVYLHTGDTLVNWARRQEKPVLVLRFCEDHCGICIDNELYMLRKHMNDCASNVILLTSYSLDLFPKIGTIKKIKYLVYNVGRDVFNWPIEGFNSPYYFILYPNGKVGDFYLPDKGYSESGREYLVGVRKIIM